MFNYFPTQPIPKIYPEVQIIIKLEKPLSEADVLEVTQLFVPVIY